MNNKDENFIQKQFIINLVERKGYEYIKSFKDLREYKAFFIQNLERVNNIRLNSDNIKKIETEIFSAYGKSSFDFFRYLNKDDSIRIEQEGNVKKLKFIDFDNISNNKFYVAEEIQLEGIEGNKRLDSMIFINGIPFIVLEFKRNSVKVDAAMKQLNDYKKNSLEKYPIFKFIQILVGSNGDSVKLWARNSDDSTKFSFVWYEKEQTLQNSNLESFINNFLDSKKLLEFIKKFIIVKNVSKKIILMRPYQKEATEEIVNFVKARVDSKALDSNNNMNNAYVWHTTGSGKTITSFKVSQMLSEEKDIKKVFFLLDRNDLSYQTTKEFSEMKNIGGTSDFTAKNISHLKELISKEKFIITTIQKLNLLLKKNKELKLENENIVFVIDECHRSQSGLMSQRIKNYFPKSIMIGFTGTPIFEENSSKETRDTFGHQLHSYNILNALKDNNVLGFKLLDYLGSQKNLEKAQRNNAEYISSIVEEIKSKHSILTLGKKYNAIMTLDSIAALSDFYDILSEDPNIFVTAIFSANDNEEQVNEDEEQGSNNNNLDDRQDLQNKILSKYNAKFTTSYSPETWTSFCSEVQNRFANYKKGGIDIVIVVNMLLTGYDSPKTNTLYVNKSLKMHTLIQAFSRTNRILDHDKIYGNIVNFSLSKENVDNAIKAYSEHKGDDAVKMIIGKNFEETEKSFLKKWDLINPEEGQDKNLKFDEKPIDWVAFDEYVKNFQDFVQEFNSIKTFQEYDEKKYSNFSIEKFNEIKSRVNEVQKSFDIDSIDPLVMEKIDFHTWNFDYDEINIDINYIKRLLNIDDIRKLISLKESWAKEELLEKIGMLWDKTKEKILYLKEESQIDQDDFELLKLEIDFLYERIINEVKTVVGDSFKYSQEKFKQIKSKVLDELVEKRKENVLKNLRKDYPEVQERWEEQLERDELSETPDLMKPIKRGQSALVDEYTIKTGNFNKIDNLHTDYSNWAGKYFIFKNAVSEMRKEI